MRYVVACVVLDLFLAKLDTDEPARKEAYVRLLLAHETENTVEEGHGLLISVNGVSGLNDCYTVFIQRLAGD